MKHADIIDRFGYRLLAKELRERKLTVAQWKSRSSIPVSDWGRVLLACKRHGLNDITLQDLYDGY